MRMHALIFHALACIHAHWRSMQFLRGRGGTGRPGPGCLCLGVRGGVPWWRWRWRWPWLWWGFATAKAARKPIHMRGELSQPDTCSTTLHKTKQKKKKIASHCIQTYLAEAEKPVISYPCLGGKAMNLVVRIRKYFNIASSPLTFRIM